VVYRSAEPNVDLNLFGGCEDDRKYLADMAMLATQTGQPEILQIFSARND
jgi:hypothetical protein